MKSSCIVLVTLILIFGCKKTNSGANSSTLLLDGSDGQIAITPVGTPIGVPVSKSIGPAGGTIISADSVVELNIPAGALTSTIVISIQPVTNEAPSGIGLSYDLLPNGTTFSKPANLTFHYSDDSISGTLPEFLDIVYQDSSNAWQTDLDNQDFDTLAKTVSIGITHFSIRSLVPVLNILQSKIIMQANQTNMLTVAQRFSHNNGKILNDYAIPDGNVSNWQIFVAFTQTPTTQYGTLSKTSGDRVTYYSPKVVDEKTLIKVTADVGPIEEYHNGKKVIVKSRTLICLFLLKPITFNYSVFAGYIDAGVAGYIGQVYVDYATFDMTITVKRGDPPDELDVPTATLSNIHNNPPTVTPTSETYVNPDGSTLTWIWIPDNTGMTNVQSITIPTPFVPEDSLLELDFNHNNATAPGHNWTSGPVPHSGTFPPLVLPAPTGVPSSVLNFKLGKETQSFGNPKSGEYVRITPK